MTQPIDSKWYPRDPSLETRATRGPRKTIRPYDVVEKTFRIITYFLACLALIKYILELS
jgi:hypothetical protein